jgi:hypothetical protein
MTDTGKQPSALPGADMTSPVDLPPAEGEEPHPLLWASVAILVAAAFLFLFNATALRGWAYQLEPGPVSERVVTVSGGWYDQTGRFGLNRPVEAMSGWWEALKDVEFGGGEAGAAEEAPAAETAPADEEPRPGFSVE